MVIESPLEKWPGKVIVSEWLTPEQVMEIMKRRDQKNMPQQLQKASAVYQAFYEREPMIDLTGLKNLPSGMNTADLNSYPSAIAFWIVGATNEHATQLIREATFTKN